MSGTVNISRRLFDSEAFRDEPLTEREAWIWLVMAASWKDRAVRSGDYVIDTKRGQLCHSVRYMAKAWDWTPAKVQRYLKRLQKLKMICSETDTGVTLVTICNYDKYQNGAKASDTGPIQDRYRTDTEKKKDERKKEGNSSLARGSRLPENWFLPVEYGQWALDQGWPETVIRSESEKFKDYWCSVPGAKGRKADWLATWRNWMRNSKSPKAITGGANGSTHNSQDGKRPDPALEQIARLAGIGQAPGNGGV